jgi:hypothetical protein
MRRMRASERERVQDDVVELEAGSFYIVKRPLVEPSDSPGSSLDQLPWATPFGVAKYIGPREEGADLEDPLTEVEVSVVVAVAAAATKTQVACTGVVV